MSGDISLIVRRTIRATAERLFDVWTEPQHLCAWFGPRPVRCSDAEVDLRVGGHYRLVNAFPDGSTLTVEGEFRFVERPSKLVYTWQVRGEREELSLVTVRFEQRGEVTEVTVVHEQVPNEATRVSHVRGWEGCLESLVQYASEPPL